jgi:hypothetical protein
VGRPARVRQHRPGRERDRGRGIGRRRPPGRDALSAARPRTGYLCAAAALRGLADQAVAGGTQVRELSLARTAHWLLSSAAAGLAPASGGRAGGDADWLTTLGSAEGAVTAVRPLGQLDGLELAWPSPLTRYGSDPAAWR